MPAKGWWYHWQGKIAGNSRVPASGNPVLGVSQLTSRLPTINLIMGKPDDPRGWSRNSLITVNLSLTGSSLSLCRCDLLTRILANQSEYVHQILVTVVHFEMFIKDQQLKSGISMARFCSPVYKQCSRLQPHTDHLISGYFSSILLVVVLCGHPASLVSCYFFLEICFTAPQLLYEKTTTPMRLISDVYAVWFCSPIQMTSLSRFLCRCLWMETLTNHILEFVSKKQGIQELRSSYKWQKRH